MEDNYKPIISLSSRDLSEIKKWKVGETYDLIVTVKQTGLHEMGSGDMMGEFEIQQVISANNDPLELEDIVNLNSDADFTRESNKYRERNR